MKKPTTYPVNDLYATIQGEGVMTGTPMILLRLHGCGVGCPWCDTKETWVVDQLNEVDNLQDALGQTAFFVRLTPQQITAELEMVYHIEDGHGWGIEWVLLTGGEPANQDLKPLVDALHGVGLKVALETSGTAVGHIGAGVDWVCVSPKIDMPGGLSIQPETLLTAHEIKHVVGKQDDIDTLVDLLEDLQVDEHNPDVTICLQPVSQSPKATDLCIKTCYLFGWRLSLQTHKFIDQR